MRAFILCLIAGFSLGANAANYYVDAGAGSDSNSGSSMSSPWKSLSAVNAKTFAPGDVISFRRGTSYSGGLRIRSSGTSTQRITFTAYGDGADPVFSNSGSYSNSVYLQASYVTVEKMKLITSSECGVNVPSGSNSNILQNIEVTDTGCGASVSGSSNVARYLSIHDLKMIRNTVGGDDDYGANGFIIGGPNNEFYGNTCVRCRASSYDYGVDGGMFELYGVTDNTYIHHNSVFDSQGLFEVGGSTGATAKNVRIAYNLVSNSMLGGIHGGGTFATAVSNFQLENNTVVDTVARNPFLYALFWVNSSVPTDAVIVRNNIFVLNGFQNVFQQNFVRSNNLYQFLNSSTGIVSGSRSLASGEIIANPLFVDPSSQNYRLQASSPEINKGLSLGYASDLDSKPLSGAPDLGAYEYQPITAPAPSPSPAPAPSPSPAPAPTVTLTTPQVTSDASNVYAKFDYTGSPNATDLFIDVDGNSSTGFSIGIGADYLAAAGQLYKYSGANGSWAWTLVKTVAFNKTSSNLSWTIGRSDLGSPSVIKVVGQVYITDTNKMISSPVSATLVAAADTMKPSIAITSPVNGSTFSTRTTVAIKASASDNVGVAQVDFVVNGSLLCKVKSAPYSCNLWISRKRGMVYQIKATARDAAGNSSTASANITSR